MKGLSFGTINLPIMEKRGCDRCYHWEDELGNCKCSELKVHKRFEDIAKWEKADTKPAKRVESCLSF